MASRGSVIPLLIKQIKTGKKLTITDPTMTRFMMSIEDAVDLVVYAFEKARPGDIYVQKAPSASLETLAKSLKIIFKSDNQIKIIGTRHGEKAYETLLTREEMLQAEDHGDYYRVKADTRDLNYDRYFSIGNAKLTELTDYNSHNAKLLTVDEMVACLLKLDYVQDKLTEMMKERH